MGQKVHPIGFRLGITTQHSYNWYAEKSQYTENLLKDIEVREHLTKNWHMLLSVVLRLKELQTMQEF